MFLLQYKCDNCGNTLWAEHTPAEWDCSCYIPEEPCDTTLRNTMSKAEHKERYREQYKLNGFSWLGKPPTMFYGELPGQYPDRTELQT